MPKKQKQNNNQQQQKSNPQPKPKKKRRGTRRRRRGRRFGPGPNYRLNFYARGVPAAQNYRTYARTSMSSRTVNSLTISGYDLVYEVRPDDLLIDGAFVCIPANPAYWTGTRIANVATAYTNYRPLYLRFDYFPAVSTMTNGVITSGSIWNGIISEGNFTQSLVTSNGGMSHPCYVRKSSRVRLGTNLTQNLYELGGRLSESSNPFIYLACTTGVNGIVPGYFMCKYTYELKNPIGDGNEYNHEIKTAGQLTNDDIWENTSAVVMSESAGLAPGVTLGLTLVNGIIQVLFKGSVVALLSDTILKIFRNRGKLNVQDDINNLGTMMYISQVTLTLYNSEFGTVYDRFFGVPEEGYVNVPMADTNVPIDDPIGFYLVQRQEGMYQLAWLPGSGAKPTESLVKVFYFPDDGETSLLSVSQYLSRLQVEYKHGACTLDMTIATVVAGKPSYQFVKWNMNMSDSHQMIATFNGLSLAPISSLSTSPIREFVGTGRLLQKLNRTPVSFKNHVSYVPPIIKEQKHFTIESMSDCRDDGDPPEESASESEEMSLEDRNPQNDDSTESYDDEEFYY